MFNKIPHLHNVLREPGHRLILESHGASFIKPILSRLFWEEFQIFQMLDFLLIRLDLPVKPQCIQKRCPVSSLGEHGTLVVEKPKLPVSLSLKVAFCIACILGGSPHLGPFFKYPWPWGCGSRSGSHSAHGLVLGRPKASAPVLCDLSQLLH